jgi:hypothetical protein
MPLSNELGIPHITQVPKQRTLNPHPSDKTNAMTSKELEAKKAASKWVEQPFSVHRMDNRMRLWTAVLEG